MGSPAVVLTLVYLTLTGSVQEEVDARHFVRVDPASVQLNAKFTSHGGPSLGYTFALRPGFGLHVQGQYNAWARESDFNRELVDKVREQAPSATAMLVRWNVVGGFEMAPLQGNVLGRPLRLALRVGAGVANTGIDLGPGESVEWGDTGVRMVGSASLEGQIALSRAWVLTAGVRGISFSSVISTVNGCDVADLRALADGAQTGREPDPGVLGSTCRADAFDGGTPSIREAALRFSMQPTAIVSILSFSAGVGVRF